MRKIACVFLSLILLSCSKTARQPPDTQTDSVMETGEPVVGTVRGQTESTEKKTAGAVSPSAASARWAYEKKVDQNGETVRKASITSPAILQFDFPYKGGSTVSLAIRQRGDQTTAYLQVSNGQFNRSFQGGSVQIQFDDKPAVGYAYSAAENGSATIIFFDETDKLIQQLKSAKITRMEVMFYGQGNRQIEFRTAGLLWNRS